jgi:hypothetical protein
MPAEFCERTRYTFFPQLIHECPNCVPASNLL